MISIHLYPSPLEHSSRILREARALSGFGLFASVELVGTGANDHAPTEQVDPGIVIRRFGVHRDRRGLVQKVIAAVGWGAIILRYYRKKPVACVNAHSVATLPLACALKWATGARLVYDPHELETETADQHGIRKIGTKIVERLLIKFVDFSIFVSPSIERWYRSHYRLDRTAVVYNSPSFAGTQPTDKFRETFGIPKNLPIFLYQGLVSHGRAVEICVDAFSALEGQAALVVMGFGDLVPWFVETAERYSNIHFHPAVPPDELAPYTASADFGLALGESISLSYDYSLPNKLFEYAALGLPVLVSAIAEQRAVVEEYGIGEVAAPLTVDAIREGVSRLLARERGDFAKPLERFRADFSWENQENTLRHIFTETLGFHPLNEGQA